MMKSPEQLKGAIRNIAEKKQIQAAAVLQMFLFERVIERLSISPYKQETTVSGNNFFIFAFLSFADIFDESNSDLHRLVASLVIRITLVLQTPVLHRLSVCPR